MFVDYFQLFVLALSKICDSLKNPIIMSDTHILKPAESCSIEVVSAVDKCADNLQQSSCIAYTGGDKSSNLPSSNLLNVAEEKDDNELEGSRDTFVDEIKSPVLSPSPVERLDITNPEGQLLHQEEATEILQEFPNSSISDSNCTVNVRKEDTIALKCTHTVEKAKNRFSVPKCKHMSIDPLEMTITTAIFRSWSSASHNFWSTAVKNSVEDILQKAFLSRGCRTMEAFLQVLRHCQEVLQEYQTSLAIPETGSSSLSHEQRTIRRKIQTFKRETDIYCKKLLYAQSLEMSEKDSIIDQEFVTELSKQLSTTVRSSPRMTRAFEAVRHVILAHFHSLMREKEEKSRIVKEKIEANKPTWYDKVPEFKQYYANPNPETFVQLFESKHELGPILVVHLAVKYMETDSSGEYKYVDEENNATKCVGYMLIQEQERIGMPIPERATMTDFNFLYEIALHYCSYESYIVSTCENRCRESNTLDYSQVYEKALEDRDHWLIGGINRVFEAIVHKYSRGPFSMIRSHFHFTLDALLERTINDLASYEVCSMSETLELLYKVSIILDQEELESMCFNVHLVHGAQVARALSAARFAHQIISLPIRDVEMCKVLGTYVGLLKQLYRYKVLTADQVWEELFPPLKASSAEASQKWRERMQAPMNACMLRGSWISQCAFKLLQFVQHVLKHESEERSFALRKDAIERLSKKFLDSDGNSTDFYKLIERADKVKSSFYNKLILHSSNLAKKNRKIRRMCEEANEEFRWWYTKEQEERRMLATNQLGSLDEAANCTSVGDSTSKMLEGCHTRKRVCTNFLSKLFPAYDENLQKMNSRERIKKYLVEGEEITEEFYVLSYGEIANELERIYEEHMNDERELQAKTCRN